MIVKTESTAIIIVQSKPDHKIIVISVMISTLQVKSQTGTQQLHETGEGQQGPSLPAEGGPSTSSTTVCIRGQQMAIAQTSEMGGTSGTGPTDTTGVANRQLGMAATPVQGGFGMGWPMDAFKWAQMHSFFPPPAVVYPTPTVARIPTAAVALPREAQPPPSTSGSSPTSHEQRTTEEGRQWDGRTRHTSPERMDPIRRRRPDPYERPRQNPPPRQREPLERARSQTTTALSVPLETLPPLSIPPGIRRELLRRRSQERDHFFGLGQLLARSNPAFALAFYSFKVFFSTFLRLAIDEGNGGASAPAPPECHRR
ncbi:hypothetical protein GPALN_004514 [Globodera pallida]|nr:hypothetical protein GPALN_004514 [Globodera pallida]